MGAEHGVRWESDGQGEYSLEVVNRDRRGTDVILHLREGEDELLSGFRLRSILRKYSDHITIPILMKKEEWDKDKNEQVVKDEDEQINQASALWARPKSEISDEQYQEFYKHVAHDFEAPLTWVHARVEGKQEYTLLLYLPSHAPFDLWDREHRHGVKLYVRRVFIMDDAEQLMPAYLRFVRGVIDSSDLPLNVSREILQESKVVEAIRSRRRSSACWGCSRTWRTTTRTSMPSSGRSSGAPSRKASARTTRTRSASPSWRASPRPTPTPRSRPSRWPNTSRG